MGFVISGLDPAPFRHLYGMDDAALSRHLAQRVVADAAFGYPDRIALRDAAIGETLLLVNYVHQPAATPYRASHAVFVREGAEEPARLVDQVPPMLMRRMLSLRAFDDAGAMVAAELIAGEAAGPVITELLASPQAAYLHAHFAVRGCFAARIDRM
ncbi:DUF1203 domain-containing protein [uncultured Sphingomonas sp.]|uniref:DUF1203 domain-containing protein n=1 Tax=uncultured Sphingomonas sp. TaxID=158754 RepID=UPI0025D4D5C3|nr:DUF1203 domain-containing protein [uncultured Sphingomonas sp.]